MYQKILVPLDGSKLAERAIPWADELARTLGAEVTLLRVVGPNDIPDEVMADGVAYQLIETATHTARGMLDLEAEQFGQVQPSHREVEYGEPGAAVVARAHVGEADLIVMTSRGRSGFERAALGSVADEVIRESHIPVLVIHDDTAVPPPLPTSILVPLDGSDLSAAVLPYVTPLARALGSKVILFWQVDLPQQGLPFQGAVIPLDFVASLGHPDFTKYLEDTVADLTREGIDAEPRIWFGSRAQSIVDFANQEHIGLIAMSTHGRKGIGRWLRGSVTDYVLTHAVAPVLTVRPGQVPLSRPVAARIAEQRPAAGETPLTLTLQPGEARALYLALDHLSWSANPRDSIEQDIRGAREALTHAAAAAHVILPYGDHEASEPKSNAVTIF